MTKTISRALELNSATSKVLKIFDNKGFTDEEVFTVLTNAMSLLDVNGFYDEDFEDDIDMDENPEPIVDEPDEDIEEPELD